MDNIKSKIIINVLLLLFTITSIVGMEFYDLRNLAKIQGDSFRRSADAVTAEIGARVGLSLHIVIKEALLKRNLDATAKIWAKSKENSLKRVDDVAKAADTKDENNAVEEARKAVHEIITLFETKMLPMLKNSGNVTKEIKELDDAINTQVNIVREIMLKIDASMTKEAKVADEKFHKAIRQIVIKTLIFGIIGILLQSILASWLMRTILKKEAERKLAEDTLRNREEILSLFMKNSPVYVYIKEVTPIGSRVLLASDNFEEMVGIAGSAMMGKMMAQLFPAEFAEKTDADDRAVVARGEVLTLDEELNGRNYTTIKFPLVQGGRTLLAGYTIDVTEQKQTADKLSSSEESFKALAEASFGGIIIHDKGYILECNKELSTITGFTYEEHIGMNGLELIAPESLDTVLANIRSGYDKSYEVVGVRKEGSKYPLIIRGKNATYKGREARVIEFRDITVRKRAEEERLSLEKQLLHVQKLESLGVLAGGIAHDFNNLLMAIMGNADLALMRINKESPAVENLHRIEQASARAADLAKQMLAYSGKGKFILENIDLNILLDEMLHMLEVSISKKAVLRLNPHQPLPAVEADSTQMRQIIMNLVINASEAIADKSGVIAITTGCMDCDRNYLKGVWLDENISEGLYVYLEIADTGCGMDKETLAKLFDPFFTTKFTGRGLGMAAVLGIVRGHKGAIKVYSEPKRGTTFKVLLPASSRPAEIFNGVSHHDDWKGEGTVLLIDDEETVRGIGTEMLKELGFSVITADDGREGVEAFRNNPDVSFIILDLTMPHMDGEQCFRELRLINPDIKVIMSSGYNEQEVTQKFAGKGLAGFIQKPYKLSVLEEAIRKM